MTDWKTDLDALVGETMAFANKVVHNDDHKTKSRPVDEALLDASLGTLYLQSALGRRNRASQSDSALALVAAIAIPLILIAPAIWNGYPLLQYDTGGYLARW